MNFSETSIVDGTLYLLGFLSFVTWSIIIFKAGEIILNRQRNHKVIGFFQTNSSISNPEHSIPDKEKSLTSQAGRLFLVGAQTYSHIQNQNIISLNHLKAWHELIERELRQQLQKEKARMESGLGWLASIGSTSPFIGLFGTVWGIMHALKDITLHGNARLEVVAGPIGEVLIATALGIAVAIPAVMAYNFFIRQNNQLLAQLEHFANDYLHGCIEKDLTKPTQDNQHGI